MNRATVVKVDGSEQELDHKPTLKEAQHIVGGWIELISVRDKRGYHRTLVVDDEGKLKDKPVNRVITNRYGQAIYGGCIVGDVIVLEGWHTVGS